MKAAFRDRPAKRPIVERKDEAGCICCGDPRLRFDNGSDSRWCEDCAEAGCNAMSCRATADIVMARIRREAAEATV